MVLVISEAVSTPEKLNIKIRKLNNTKHQYIEHNEAVHALAVSIRPNLLSLTTRSQQILQLASQN